MCSIHTHGVKRKREIRNKCLKQIGCLLCTLLRAYVINPKGMEWNGQTWRAQLILTAPWSRRRPLVRSLVWLSWSTKVNLWNARTTRPSLVFTTPWGLSVSPIICQETLTDAETILSFGRKNMLAVHDCLNFMLGLQMFCCQCGMLHTPVVSCWIQSQVVTVSFEHTCIRLNSLVPMSATKRAA